MRECLETWEDQSLDAVIAADARSSGLEEDDVVEVVRQYRGEEGRKRAAS